LGYQVSLFPFIVGFGYLSLKIMIIVAVLAKLITVGFDLQNLRVFGPGLNPFCVMADCSK
jgi:hypothetical protein